MIKGKLERILMQWYIW